MRAKWNESCMIREKNKQFKRSSERVIMCVCFCVKKARSIEFMWEIECESERRKESSCE